MIPLLADFSAIKSSSTGDKIAQGSSGGSVANAEAFADPARDPQPDGLAIMAGMSGPPPRDRNFLAVLGAQSASPAKPIANLGKGGTTLPPSGGRLPDIPAAQSGVLAGLVTPGQIQRATSAAFSIAAPPGNATGFEPGLAKLAQMLGRREAPIAEQTRSSASIPDRPARDRAAGPPEVAPSADVLAPRAGPDLLSAELSTPGQAPSSGSASAASSGPQVNTSALPPAAAAQAAPAPAASSTAPATQPAPILGAQAEIESIINQMSEARESGRNLRPELALRHTVFGTVNMRLDMRGGDLCATLTSRDPGFVPAVQAAFAERAVAPATETTASGSTRTGDQGGGSGQGAGAQGQSADGQGARSGTHGGAAYGSFLGSGDAAPQPYLEQQERKGHETASPGTGKAQSAHPDAAGDRGIYA